MDYIIKNVADLDGNEIKQCRRLNLGDNGAMRDEFNWYRKHPSKDTKAILAKDGDRVVGWALAFPYSIKKKCVYFYVRKSERRKGIGTNLILHAQKIERKPYVAPHNYISGKFFKANRNLLTIQRGDSGARYVK